MIQTCALNSRGGVEANLIVTPLLKSSIDPEFSSRGFYCVVEGHQTIPHVKVGILEKNFEAKVLDVTRSFGILSIQGPKSEEILSKIANVEDLKFNSAKVVKFNEIQLRIVRTSFGFELHIPSKDCVEIYNQLMATKCLTNAGFRALNSLNLERGQHLNGFDRRSDDSPLEAQLHANCREDGSDFKGHNAMIRRGIQKKLIYLTIDEKIPIWGLEGVYRNGEIVAHLRRGEWSHTLNKALGNCYIRGEGDGEFEVEVMGKLHKAQAHLKSPVYA